MCRENTQKPQIPHCWCRWKDPTKPNHFISANSLSYCRMPLRCWVLRCHTTNWESQQGPLFGPRHRLCTATVITTIIWLPETSNACAEAAGICIFPFDLGDLNKASSHSVKGVKVTMSCAPVCACESLLPLWTTAIVALILATEWCKSRIKDKYNLGSTKGLVDVLHTRTDITSSFRCKTGNSLLFPYHRTTYSCNFDCRYYWQGSCVGIVKPYVPNLHSFQWPAGGNSTGSPKKSHRM